ncbi:recombination regulator RecX [Litorilituus lipolyticus]|uniref:Regulatory protein RecX n=1 Tax=Litorilituus lipolyticus TaxID=2491017 RepID=A0A502LAC2_9GAMM|nr:recombination regulator RecX [Litorilituus lipolyticus]TPH19355.1 recombination regulator RecX [Litorilituus lipolyticus]
MKSTALQCAVGLLARREYSELEIQQKLKQREYQQSDIDAAIAQLLKKNYLSDDRFAETVCRYRSNRGYGWQYIANELKQKGVCSTIIHQLHKNCEIDWYLQAELAYNKRFGIKTIFDQKDKAKRIRFLQYRGFSTEEILTVVNANYAYE